ncbi:MAG: EAL domain-containing protein [Betaproteobacteria bacterium]
MTQLNQFSEFDPVSSTKPPAISRRLRLVVWMFAAIVVALVFFSYYSIGLMSASRAYVAGEGMWSKGQKEAVYSLLRYTRLRNEDDFTAYQAAMAVMRGDREARLELEKPNPDLRIAFEGFVRGRNHPDDIDGMIHLFRNFRDFEPIDKALEVWVKADILGDRLMETGRRIRADIQSNTLDSGGVELYTNELHQLNAELTPLEDAFSYNLSVASRRAEDYLLGAMVAIVAILLAAAFALSRRLMRQNEGVQAMLRESGNQLRNLLQFAPLPIIMSRVVDQTIVYANDRALAQLKLLPSSLGQQKSQDLYVRREDREHLIETLRNDSSVRDWEIQLKDTQGKPFWVLMSSQRISYMGESCILTALNNVDDRKRAQDDLRHRAFHDELTALPNRAMFMDSLNRALLRMQRKKGRFSVLFIDLDRFKVVNDTLGHDAGDRLLQLVATRIKSNVRESDLVARLGGDEFVILVEEHGALSEVAHVAQSVLSAMEQRHVLDGREVNLTASIGISSYPEDGVDLNTLVKNADIAMYQAKELGRNNFQFYTAAQNQLTLRRFDLEVRLRRAMDRNEFVLHYQPIIDLTTETMVGVEALLRWNDPDQGMILPAEFIPIAEESGAIVPIGHWVLEQACMQVKAWNLMAQSPLTVAVNMSPRQFANGNFMIDLQQALKHSGLEPGALHLEITETMMMREHALTEIILAALGELGVGVAIDDFGTGYSSLSQMRRIPANFIKIDRSFVEDCPDDAGSVAIVRAIIAMAHSLKLKVIAEGVETEEQLKLLATLGCDMAQGYLFSVPVAAEELALVRADGDTLRKRFAWRVPPAAGQSPALKSVGGGE